LRNRPYVQAILKDIVELADSQEQKITIVEHSGKAAEAAILSQVGRDGDDLIVMGVARPVGDELFFGEIAAAVFEKTPASILLVSS
jgi:nucleotide-binding universal stress UspA family protein